MGQESLYRISKAYSVYDSEVLIIFFGQLLASLFLPRLQIGYCQGQSFLIAALLLQMPEEQAFGVLVKVMHRWGLRDMFKENFEQLQLRLHQLDRLLETSMPDLWQHFQVRLEKQGKMCLFTNSFFFFVLFSRITGWNLTCTPLSGS